MKYLIYESMVMETGTTEDRETGRDIDPSNREVLREHHDSPLAGHPAQSQYACNESALNTQQHHQGLLPKLRYQRRGTPRG